MKKHEVRCFVCSEGHIWSVNSSGESNYPLDIEIVGNTVRVLGPKESGGEGRLIVDEYVLWPSLTALAAQIER